jgi:type IV pilus assembly protein PilC
MAPSLPPTLKHADEPNGISFGARKKVPPAAIAEFARSVAVMSAARLPLVDALAAAESQTRNTVLRNAIRGVRRDVERGRGLFTSFHRQGHVFPPLFARMVEIGEAAGVLDEVLLRLATFLEKSVALRQKVRMALLYPAVILAVAVGAVAFMLIVIVPTFASMFADFGAELPGPTRMVLALSQLVTGNVLLWTALLAGFVVANSRVRRYPAVRARLDWLKLRMPLVGALVSKSEAARLCRTLGTLLRSGVPLSEAIDVTHRASENMVIRGLVSEMRRATSQGRPMTHPLQTSSLFPPMVTQMLRVGEETARLPDMLLHVSDHYETELDRLLDGLSSVIEPAMIILIGAMVGGMLVALYLPIFELVGLSGME